ncbi:hypothetical protein HY29_13325 [Hyphomonas beringensis]|uniref:DUF1552 domain-containing protein n=1 Tax=Hyphomonas beringensis TaxID=1280946 RepID=A0A062UDW7_9PROT|nr:DUF1552 domain-containing protein [Hyphomonas beringensis]KCZ54774.1 hypothetical protein HY29_13325 [Hyphomonas beringensis]
MSFGRTNPLSRRTLLRGMFQGSALAIGLPWLEGMFPAFAGTGAVRQPPLRFGTWFWGCGVTPGRWSPTLGEAGFALQPESLPLESIKEHLNFLTGFDAILDGRPNHVHVSGTFSLRSGIAPLKFGVIEGGTFETAIADRLGVGTRFKSLDFTATGNPADTYSYRSAQVRNTPETSARALYDRIFAAGLRKPGEGEFKPDPKTLSRISVLSAVSEQRKALEANLGAEDRRRLDQYFTSVREVEQQLELQTEEPVIPEACQMPERPGEHDANYDLANVHENHKLMAKLLALAMACDQTRNFNVVFSNSASSLHRSGEASSHHLYTHEEFTDPDVGYQIETSKFVIENMKGWAAFVQALADVPEGDGTLLDNCLVFAHSDTSWAKIHAVQGIPMMTAGRAGGRIKTGQVVTANGDPITRVGLTMQQIAGVPIERWGTRSMETDNSVTQILA